MFVNEMRYTAFLGLRWMISDSIPPIVIDYGFMLNRRHGDPFGAFSLNIGYTFLFGGRAYLHRKYGAGARFSVAMRPQYARPTLLPMMSRRTHDIVRPQHATSFQRHHQPRALSV